MLPLCVSEEASAPPAQRTTLLRVGEWTAHLLLEASALLPTEVTSPMC